jgi:hypothetical protein
MVAAISVMRCPPASSICQAIRSVPAVIITEGPPPPGGGDPSWVFSEMRPDDCVDTTRTRNSDAPMRPRVGPSLGCFLPCWPIGSGE